MKVLVIGAGVVGVTTAFYLQADGHDVTVIERNQIAGVETSFANAGQLCIFFVLELYNLTPDRPLVTITYFAFI